MSLSECSFVGDEEKERLNIQKHGVSFREAALVFSDPDVHIYFDKAHSSDEERLYAIGKVGDEILTVRFVYREGKIRIFGAGYWRDGRRRYEAEKKQDWT